MCAAESQPVQDRGDLGVDVIAAAVSEGLLDVAISLKHLVVLGRRNVGITKPSFEGAHLPLDGEEVVKGLAGFFEQRATGVGQTLLRQVPNGQAGGTGDEPGVRFVESGHHAKQCGLASSIRPTEADSRVGLDLPVGVVDQDACAKRFSHC